MNKFKTTIGLEIHVELNTKRKMFCDCINPASLSSKISDRKPNTFCCPTCMGFPGTLPRTNELAIEFARLTGIALNCEIQKESKFDRKHYFYPDLPKGYQISQYDMPFCKNGFLEIDGEKTCSEQSRRIRINRVHLEEDAGKLIHHQDSGESFVDLNRAGTPLIEIVTEPDLESPEQAKEFVKKLRDIIRAIGVSDADMEKGHLRCDANIDVKLINSKSQETNSKQISNSNFQKMSPIVEIKNLNSFRFIEKALEFEVERLSLDQENWPEEKSKITRGFDSKTGETYEQRRKEEAADYRYFPEPDLPVYTITDDEISKLKVNLKDLPEDLENQMSDMGISKEQVSMLSSDKKLREIFNTVLKEVNDPRLVLTYLMLIRGIVKKGNSTAAVNIKELVVLLKEIKSGNIKHEIGKRLLSKMAEGERVDGLLEGFKNQEEYDINKVIDKVISSNTKAVSDFRKGQQNAVGFLVGSVMKETKGAANPQEVKKLIIEKL